MAQLILEDIRERLLSARKTRDVVKTKLLITLLGEVEMVGKTNGNRLTTNPEAIRIIKKFIKGVEEIRSLSGDQPELVNELIVYNSYLPTMYSPVEVERLIENIITVENLSSMKDMGIVMNQLKIQFEGLYDGKIASDLVRKLLSSR